MFCVLDFLSGFAALGILELYLIANFSLILVEFDATCNIILLNANKWYETEKSATLSHVVKMTSFYQHGNFINSRFSRNT